MQTIEVPRTAWRRTLDEFTALHEGWLVSLDIMGADIGAQHELVNLPLLGISADPIDRGDDITISAARSSGDHASHTIPHATRLQIERTNDGADAAVQIEASDGTRSILRFRAVALPETVDGIVRH